MTLIELIQQAGEIWRQREHWRIRCCYEYRKYQEIIDHVGFPELYGGIDYRREAIHSYCLMLRCDGDLQRLQEQYETEHGSN